MTTEFEFTFDRTTCAPVVVVTVAGSPDQERLQQMLAELVSEYESWTEPGLILFDLTGVKGFDSAGRRALAQWRARNMPLLQSSIRGVAYVIGSMLVRGFYTAVNWLMPNHAVPRIVVPNREAGLRWLRSRQSGGAPAGTDPSSK